jgi:NADPH:quinone reductase-like Zn-dependent oxidoreductase
MKAVVLHEYGGPDKLQWEDVDDPKPGDREVLVRLTASSVNPVDWKMRSGEVKERFPVEFPGILGRDITGIVRELGPRVTGFEPGDKVMALGLHAYAELVVIKASDLAKVPEGLDLSEAAGYAYGRAVDPTGNEDSLRTDGPGDWSRWRGGPVRCLDSEEGRSDGDRRGPPQAVERSR